MVWTIRRWAARPSAVAGLWRAPRVRGVPRGARVDMVCVATPLARACAVLGGCRAAARLAGRYRRRGVLEPMFLAAAEGSAAMLEPVFLAVAQRFAAVAQRAAAVLEPVFLAVAQCFVAMARCFAVLGGSLAVDDAES